MKYMREPSRKSKWYLPKMEFRTAYYFALQYPEWVVEYANMEHAAKGSELDGLPRGSDVSRTTEQTGIRRADLKRKIDIVEETAKEAGGALYPYILKAVTTEGISYLWLKNNMGIPMGKDVYYDRRRKFYYLLAEKI